MQNFAENLHLGPLEPDREGKFTLVFDDRLPVQCFPWGKQEMILSGVIGKVPEDEWRAEEQLKRLLKENLGKLSGQQEVLSLEKEAGEIILYLRIPLDGMGAEDFMRTMENFVNRLEFRKNFAREAGEKG